LFSGLHPVSAQENWVRKPEWIKHFRAAKANGSILIYDLNRNHYSAFNVKRANAVSACFDFQNSKLTHRFGNPRRARRP
jgi:hypothetical protein